MPTCYLLTCCGGSALDQQSNNFSLFNLVEQVNVPANAPHPPKGLLPLEVHAYWQLSQQEVGREFEVRYVLVAATGLETPSEVFKHRWATPRFRTRTYGVPLPPVIGAYELRVDWREAGNVGWRRDQSAWPITFADAPPPQNVTRH